MTRAGLVRRLASLVCITVAWTLAANLTSAGEPPPYPTWNHYTVYRAGGLPPYNGYSASLVDQFGGNEAALTPPTFFLVPASKNMEPIEDSVTHQTCYGLTGPTFNTTVAVTHQLGTELLLTLGDPNALCVPTDKIFELDGDDPNSLISPQHFQCYQASGAAPPPPSSVTIKDQFMPAEGAVSVLDPFLFCNPVDKNGEGNPNPGVHLTCYYIAPPQIITLPPVFIQNQYTDPNTDWSINVIERVGLCLPSAKFWEPTVPPTDTPLPPPTDTPVPPPTDTPVPPPTDTPLPPPTDTPVPPPTDTPVVPPTPSPTIPPPPTCATTPLPVGTCTVSKKSVVLMKDIDPTDPSLQRFVWKWIRGNADIADFGNPVTGGTTHTLCVYDDNALVWTPEVQAGGTCGTKDCWKASPTTGTAKRYRYVNKDTNADGVFKVVLKAGTGNAKIMVKGTKDNLALPLPIAEGSTVTIQLINNAGATCWESVFTAPSKISDGYFRDKES